jgi:hypothetical protein
MKRSEKFDSFDTNVGKYSARKVPKWVCNNNDLIEYLKSFELEEDLPLNWEVDTDLKTRPA